MPSEITSNDALIASGDDDATVAREPSLPAPRESHDRSDSQLNVSRESDVIEAPPEEASTVSRLQTLQASDVDLASGSSLVMSDGRAAGMVSAPRKSDSRISTSGTAYFMKPMPTKSGGVAPEAGSLALPDAATQLWKKLVVDNADESVDPSVPVPLEHFEVGRVIGRGGMGAVFLAKDTRLNRRVALKILAPEHTTSKSAMDRFRNEARAAAKLDHENIARVHYLGGDFSGQLASSLSGPTLPFIAFEFVEGTNVRQLIRERGAFSAEETVRIAVQLANALRHTVAFGVVHRDIKPSNVIITPTGRAKLVDLGLARTEDPDASRDLTVAGTTLGTFDYISPEQAKDPRTADIRSDLYSLGCTLFHMVVGTPPYPDGTMLQKLLDHQDRIVPDAHSLNRKVPLALSDLIKRLMEPLPAERPQTPDALLYELAEVASAMGIRSSSGNGLIVFAARHARLSEVWRRYIGWIISAAVLFVVAIFTDQLGGAGRIRTISTEPASRISETDQPSASSELLDLESEGRAGNGLVSGPVPVAPPGSKPLPTDATMANDGDTGTSPAAEPASTDIPPSTSPDAKRGSGGPATAENGFEIEIPATTTAAKPYVVLQDGQRTAYSLLSEAIKQSVDGAIIEVTRGGVITGSEQFTRISRKSIEIRAAKGLVSRPLIRMVQPQSTSAETIRLFQLLEGGALRFDGVDLEIIVPQSAARTPWRIFSLVEDTSIRFHDSSITVRNPNGADVCILHASMSMDSTAGLVSLSLDQCLVRGAAAVIRSDGICPLEADVTSTAFAVGKPLLDVRPTTMPAVQRTTSPLTIHMSDSTWAGSTHMLLIEAERDSLLADLYMDIHDCIFASLDPTAALVMLTGSWYYDDLAPLLTWNGKNNVHSGLVAWQVSSTESTGRGLSLEEWAVQRGVMDPKSEISVTTAIVGQRNYPEKSLIDFGPAEFVPIPDELTYSYRVGSGLDPVGVRSPTTSLPVPTETQR